MITLVILMQPSRNHRAPPWLNFIVNTFIKLQPIDFIAGREADNSWSSTKCTVIIIQYRPSLRGSIVEVCTDGVSRVATVPYPRGTLLLRRLPVSTSLRYCQPKLARPIQLARHFMASRRRGSWTTATGSVSHSRTRIGRWMRPVATACTEQTGLSGDRGGLSRKPEVAHPRGFFRPDCSKTKLTPASLDDQP